MAAGKYYVNSARKIAREVLEIDDKIVKFYTHHLDTGNSCPSASECTIRDFTQWADHEATPTEMAGLHLRKMEAMLYEPRSLNSDAQRPIVIDLASRALIGETTRSQRSPS